MAEPTLLDNLPAPRQWMNMPECWAAGPDRLLITAPPLTNWFISPRNGERTSSGPVLLFKAGAEFTLTAKVTAALERQWDAGMLMVYAGAGLWAKLAFEKSIYQEPTIISVVTRGVSDDCNSAAIDGNSTWLRIVRAGMSFVFFYSNDAVSWRQVRVFTLGEVAEVWVGFGVQSPIGNGAAAEFSTVTYTPEVLE